MKNFLLFFIALYCLFFNGFAHTTGFLNQGIASISCCKFNFAAQVNIY